MKTAQTVVIVCAVWLRVFFRNIGGRNIILLSTFCLLLGQASLPVSKQSCWLNQRGSISAKIPLRIDLPLSITFTLSVPSLRVLL